MTRTPDEIKKGLADNIAVHYHPGDLEPRLTPLTMVDLEELHAEALAFIQQLQAENAQQARCIENMTDKLNAMNDEVAKLQAERDEAVSELVGTCQVCRWEETAKCASCHFCEYAWNVHESNWEWRGVQKED